MTEMMGEQFSNVRADEQATKQIPRTFDSLRFVLDASAQCRAQIKQLEGNLVQIDHLCAMIEGLQTDFADAVTVIKAMAEADEDSDSGAVQCIARAFLKRTQATQSGAALP